MPDRDRLLADIEMAEAADQPHAVELARLLLEAPDQEHVAIIGEQLVHRLLRPGGFPGSCRRPSCRHCSWSPCWCLGRRAYDSSPSPCLSSPINAKELPHPIPATAERSAAIGRRLQEDDHIVGL